MRSTGQAAGALLVLLQLLANGVIAMRPHGMPRGMSLGSHLCIHDKIALENVPMTKVKSEDGEHKRQSTSEFSPIRITLHLVGPLHPDLEDSLTRPDGPMMKALEVLSNTLYVRPLQGNLTIPPACDTWTTGTNNGKCRVLHTDTDCGIFSVPEQFIGTAEVCENSFDANSCEEQGPDGPGAADTDFLLFAGTTLDSNCLFFQPIAFAASCGIDEWHRTSTGFINVCSNVLIDFTNADEVDAIFFNLLIHEISHALGFSRFSFEDFHDGNLNFYRPDILALYDGSTITAINSPKVLEEGRNYFGCEDLPFVPLENQGGSGSASSHWESRVLHHETMAPFLSNDYSVYSKFTLAFFEDSGWYQVNYTYINTFDQFTLQWGRGLGCEFVLESCRFNPEVYPYLCDEDIIRQCTFDRISMGQCSSGYTFFDGCPVVVAGDNDACIHDTNTPAPNSATEVYGPDSICVELNSTVEDCIPVRGTPRCYERAVVAEEGTERLAFSITVGGSETDTHWCYDSEFLWINRGLLFCPSIDEILLRVTEENITTVSTLPELVGVVVANTSALDISGSGSTFGSASGFGDGSAIIPILPYCDGPPPLGCTSGDIRLENGATPYEGRVEVCLNNEWGTVCDDGWGTSDAIVACRQLGFDTVGVIPFYFAFFGQGTGEIFMNLVSCSGNEERLIDCPFSTDFRFCAHYEDAGVRCPGPCQDGSLRLVNGYYGTVGAVEICLEGRWRGLCGETWDNKDASVVCRQLGFSPFGAYAHIDVIGPSATRFVVAQLQCSGLEGNLTACIESAEFVDSCSPYGEASVACHNVNLPNASCTDGVVRLRNGYLDGEGRVEVCVNNAWGTVCDDGWDDADASVVCRQLGYYPIGTSTRFAFFGQGRGPILLEDVACSGLEGSLLNCGNTGIGLAMCGHYEDAGVICQIEYPVPPTPCTLGSIRLVGGQSELEGRVEVCFGDLWVAICSDNWDNRDAGVICRQLFNSTFGGLALNASEVVDADDAPATVIHSINCIGTEISLSDCPSNINSGSTCSAAAVICNPQVEEVNVSCSDGEVRLANGLTETEGRVEICFNNTWGPVCVTPYYPYSWESGEANVVCKQLGFVPLGATPFRDSFFGVSYEPALLEVFGCGPGDDELLECDQTRRPSCGITDQVGVRCIAPGNDCEHGSIRLFNQRQPNLAHEGTVELCLYGIWGTICDLYWDTLDATVTCRQLGFFSLGAIARRFSYFGRGRGPIWLAEVYCLGGEPNLLNCSLGTEVPSYCTTHYYDAGVQCPAPTNETCSEDGDIRLANGRTALEGRVEICYDGRWGTVCDNSWSSNDGIVACRQLGYSPFGSQLRYNAYFGQGTGGIYLDSLGCDGTEGKLVDCPHQVIGVHNCFHYDDAGLICQGM